VCDRHWELVYKQDEFGNSTFGNKQELIELAVTGNYVKANLYMPDHVLQLPADSISIYNGELCVQSLRSLAHNGTHVDTSDPWLYFLVCTTGHVTERDVFNASIFRVSIDWYIKDIASDKEPIYSNFVDGTPLEPTNILRLHEAAKRMSLFGAMRDRAYVFPFHNINLDSETGEVNGQNVLHIGQRQNLINKTNSEQNSKQKWNSGQRINAVVSDASLLVYINFKDAITRNICLFVCIVACSCARTNTIRPEIIMCYLPRSLDSTVWKSDWHILFKKKIIFPNKQKRFDSIDRELLKR
ncbi:unnamed protein product, partial [Candidula unifasciata]